METVEEKIKQEQGPKEFKAKPQKGAFHGDELSDMFQNGDVFKGRTGLNDRDQRVRDKMDQIAEQYRHSGIQPATVINLLPFELHVPGPVHYGLVVPPCLKGQEFSKHVITKAKFAFVDRGPDAFPPFTDNVDPIIYLPIQLAEEFQKQYVVQQNKGGVFFYAGDHDPKSSQKTRDLFGAALKKRNAYLMGLFVEGNSAWADPSGAQRRIIKHDVHGTAAEILFNNNLIPELPEWVTANQEGAKLPTCAECGKVVAPSVSVCTNCNYIVNPFLAYERGVGPFTDLSMNPFNHVSMERLTEEQFAIVEKMYKKRLKRSSLADKAKD